jgi:hypothetical protein
MSPCQLYLGSHLASKAIVCQIRVHQTVFLSFKLICILDGSVAPDNGGKIITSAGACQEECDYKNDSLTFIKQEYKRLTNVCILVFFSLTGVTFRASF